MKAMVLRRAALIETQPLSLAELPDPTPEAEEILIAVRTCGICRTDLHIVEGELELPRLPIVPGHQAVGKVVAAGRSAKRFGLGERVGVPWLHWTCGECAYCRAGKENLCARAQFTGLHVNGGYASLLVAHQDFSYRLPEGLDDLHTAPLLCAGVIGYRAYRLSEIRPGGRLGLYGFGASAHLVLQVAVHQGCRVFVFSRSEDHRRLAESLGARWTGSAEQDPGEKLDAAIVFAPSGPLVHYALAALDKGGTCALAGIYMTPIPEMDYGRLLYHERALRSAANSTRRDVEEFLRLAGEIPLRTEIEVFPLEQANRGLQEMKRGVIRGAGVLEVGGQDAA